MTDEQDTWTRDVIQLLDWAGFSATPSANTFTGEPLLDVRLDDEEQSHLFIYVNSVPPYSVVEWVMHQAEQDAAVRADVAAKTTKDH